MDELVPEWWASELQSIFNEDAVPLAILTKADIADYFSGETMTEVPIDYVFENTSARLGNPSVIGALIDDIKKHGITNPITINRSGEIIDGAYRHRAAKECGLKTVPCYIRGKEMRHWFGMCELLYRHHWGMGIDRFLRLGYIPEHERKVLDTVQWSQFSENGEKAREIYLALRNQDYQAMKRLAMAGKTSMYIERPALNRLILDLEDPMMTFDFEELRTYRTSPDVMMLARSCFENPEAGNYPMFADTLMEAGCVNVTLLHHIQRGFMTRGSVILQQLIWDTHKDGIKSCPVSQM